MLKNREGILTLIAEIKQGLGDLELISKSIVEVGKKIKVINKKEKRYYLESVALELHNFYSGCERIFEKIAGDLNGGVPTTHDWHKRILQNMMIDIPKIDHL